MALEDQQLLVSEREDRAARCGSPWTWALVGSNVLLLGGEQLVEIALCNTLPVASPLGVTLGPMVTLWVWLHESTHQSRQPGDLGLAC